MAMLIWVSPGQPAVSPPFSAKTPATTSSLLTLSATGTATTGTVNVTVTGSSGSLTNTTTVSLTVNPKRNFALSASPGSLSMPHGASGASTSTVAPRNGVNGKCGV